ncbi:MAG: hypothetical protein GY795_22935, partial [Desulfobacterales bacterium]|nr:hypothetical protein [Desulfobacterales bacterium]
YYIRNKSSEAKSLVLGFAKNGTHNNRSFFKGKKQKSGLSFLNIPRTTPFHVKDLFVNDTSVLHGISDTIMKDSESFPLLIDSYFSLNLPPEHTQEVTLVYNQNILHHYWAADTTVLHLGNLLYFARNNIYDNNHYKLEVSIDSTLDSEIAYRTLFKKGEFPVVMGNKLEGIQKSSDTYLCHTFSLPAAFVEKRGTEVQFDTVSGFTDFEKIMDLLVRVNRLKNGARLHELIHLLRETGETEPATELAGYSLSVLEQIADRIKQRAEFYHKSMISSHNQKGSPSEYYRWILRGLDTSLTIKRDEFHGINRFFTGPYRNINSPFSSDTLYAFAETVYSRKKDDIMKMLFILLAAMLITSGCVILGKRKKSDCTSR